MAAKPGKKTPAAKADPTLEEKIERWLKARQLEARARRLKEELEPEVKAALRAIPGKRLEFGVTTLFLSEYAQRHLDREAAEAKLGKGALDPFYKEIEVSKIVVS